MITIDPPSSSPTHKAAAALSKSGLTRFLNRARTAVGLAGAVEVLLTTDAELKRLNRTFRGKNKATDVLSFPAFEGQDGLTDELAGDLAVSLETAARQAAAFGHSLRDEVRILLLHGLLHLAGLDHETDAGEMAEREALLRQELRLPNGLIARVSGAKTAPRRIAPKRIAPRKTAPRKLAPKKLASQKRASNKPAARRRP